MNTKIVLYILIFNKEALEYEILSEHPDKFEECSVIVKESTDIDTQLSDLYSKYLDLSPDYIKFIFQKPFIEDNFVKLPFYCIVPYHDFNIKNSYRISCNTYAKFIPNIRKILNHI